MIVPTKEEAISLRVERLERACRRWRFLAALAWVALALLASFAAVHGIAAYQSERAARLRENDPIFLIHDEFRGVPVDFLIPDGPRLPEVEPIAPPPDEKPR